MPNSDYLALGDYNAECSMCEGKFKASELRKHWAGMFRCDRCWEPRQPQDFVKAGSPEEPVPWSQPPNEVFIEFCTVNQSSAVPNYAEPGCMIPNNSLVIPGIS